MNFEEKIKVKAMCLFHRNGKILASKGFDKVKQETFYRALGGSVNFFETAEAGVRREIQEELLSEIENLQFIDVIENLFTHEGSQGHELVFLYVGELVRKELYDQNPIHIIEETYEFDAEWIAIEDVLNGKITLYPALDYKSLFKRIFPSKS